MTHWQRLIFLLCLLTTQTLSAQTYYLSNTGNDANDGLSPETAWQTVDNLNSGSFTDGDTFLFKSGEVFRGSIKLLRSPTNLTFSTYGGTDKAVIAGSVVVQNWTPTTHPALNAGVVYEASVAGLLPQNKDGEVLPVQHLFVNGQLMTIARYPNVLTPLDKNWLKVDKGGANFFIDAELAAYGKPDNYWKGATLRIRNYSWTNTVLEISGYNAASGRLAVQGLKSQLPEWGYFIDDKLEELDVKNEWYYDANSQKIYLYPPDGVNPNQALIEAAVYSTGLSIDNHKDNSTAENFEFRHFTTQALHVNSSDNVRVQNCYFIHNVKGITTWNTADVSINNNFLNHQLHSSIGLQANVSQGFDVKNSVVENNTILNTALYRAYGVRYDGIYQGNAIDVYGKAYTVRGNYIENVAENGIFVKDGGHHLIENNVVKNALLVLNDGGAISIGSDGNTIRGNFLSGSVGNVDESNGCGTTNRDPCTHHAAYGMGIGSDSKFKNNVIEENVVFNNSDIGIRLNSFQNSIVRNNILYNNDPQIVVQDLLGTSANNLIENNIIVSAHSAQLGLQLTNETHHGDINNNYYCNPYSELAVMRDGQRYSLAHWKQTFSRYDSNSRDCNVLLPTQNVQPIGANIMPNATFDTDIKGWNPLSQPLKIFHDTTQLDNGSLKTVFDSGSRLLTLTPNTSFSFQQNQWYRVTFSVVAQDFGDIQLRFNKTKPAHEVYTEHYFAIDKQRRDYQYIFQSQITDDSMKLFFTTDKEDSSTYWIDNVNLEPVALQPSMPAEKQIELFTNDSYETKTINLAGATYVDLSGNAVGGTINLPPYSAKVLLRTSNNVNVATLDAPKLHLKVKQNKIFLDWTEVLGAQGYLLYYAPYPEVDPIQSVDMQLNRHFELQLEGGIGLYVAVVAYNRDKELLQISNIEQFVLH